MVNFVFFLAGMVLGNKKVAVSAFSLYRISLANIFSRLINIWTVSISSSLEWRVMALVGFRIDRVIVSKPSKVKFSRSGCRRMSYRRGGIFSGKRAAFGFFFFFHKF